MRYQFISNLRIDNEIEIRQIERSDFNGFYNLINKNREYLTPSMKWVGITTKKISFPIWDEVILANQKGLRNLKDRKAISNCAIFYKNKMVGSIYLVSNSETVVEIGYWIDEDFQGKGIMTKTVKAVIDCCLNNLKFEKVLIAIRVENKKSQKVVERISGYKIKKLIKKIKNRGDEDYYFYYY